METPKDVPGIAAAPWVTPRRIFERSFRISFFMLRPEIYKKANVIMP
jgi:hypothetical protein